MSTSRAFFDQRQRLRDVLSKSTDLHLSFEYTHVLYIAIFIVKQTMLRALKEQLQAIPPAYCFERERLELRNYMATSRSISTNLFSKRFTSKRCSCMTFISLFLLCNSLLQRVLYLHVLLSRLCDRVVGYS